MRIASGLARLTQQHLALAAVIAATSVALSGCPKRPVVVVDTEGGYVTRSTDAAANASFDEARALYEAGDYRQATAAFQLFAAEFPHDTLAVEAEFYAGRSLLAEGRTVEGRQIFSSLTTDADPTVQVTATLYLAFVDALEATSTADGGALDLVLADPTVHLPLLHVVPGDEALLASLMAERRWQSRDVVQAVPDLAVVYRFGDATLADYAILRGEAIAAMALPSSDVERWIESDDPFLSSIAVLSRVRALLAAGDRAGASALLESLGPQMQTVGLLGAYAQAHADIADVSDTDGLRFGAVLSLSGANRRAARAALGAMLLAERAFDREDARTTLVIRDSAGDPALARQAVQALADAGVSAIIGPVDASLVTPIAEEAALRGLPVISLASVAPDAATDGLYRVGLNARAEAEAVVQVLADDRSCLNYAVIERAQPGAFYTAFGAGVADAAEARGAVVASWITFDGESDQLAAEASTASLAHADVCGVILALEAEAASAMVAHMAAENIWSAGPAGDPVSGRRSVHIGGNSFMLDEALVRNAARYLEGAVIPFWFDPSLADGRALEFATRYAFVIGRDPGVLEAFAFDAAARVRRHLLTESARTPDLMRARLEDGALYEGALGAWSFDAQGELVLAPQLATVAGEAFVPLEAAP